jgi:hypothetical protein
MTRCNPVKWTTLRNVRSLENSKIQISKLEKIDEFLQDCMALYARR